MEKIVETILIHGHLKDNIMYAADVVIFCRQYKQLASNDKESHMA